jgi:hypothetical protein
VIPPPTIDEILMAARLAVDSFFRGEFATKRSIRMDHEALRALLNAYDARQETTTIVRPDRSHA